VALLPGSAAIFKTDHDAGYDLVASRRMGLLLPAAKLVWHTCGGPYF
jgi:hypothetical protein